jgi:ParB-like chromosome segregation protein Spo0J
MYYKDILVNEIKLIPQTDLPPLPPLSSSELDELRESIKKYGILQPLLVTTNGDDGYLLQAGYNRLRVAQELDLHVVPCCIAIKIDDITDILMGSDTDGFRRHLTPDQKNELLMWQTGLKKIKKRTSRKLNTSMSSSSEDESALLKKIINQKEQMIKNLQNELESNKITFKEKEADYKKEITDKKKTIKELKEEYKKAIEDAEDIKYQSNQTEPSDNERITKLQEDLDDANERANRISEELETARKKQETLEESLRKEKNNNISITAGINAKLYHLRRETIAQGKLRAAKELLEDTQKIIAEVADIVKRDEVSVNTKPFLTLLEKLTETVSAIPFYPSKQESVDAVTGQ